MSKHLRSIVLIVVAVILVIFIVEKFVAQPEATSHLDYGAFYQKLEAGQVASFHAVGLQATGDLTTGTKYGVSVPNTDQAFVDEVYKKVKTAAISFEQQTNSGFLNTVITVLPLAVMVGLFLFILRNAQSRRKPSDVVRALAREDAQRESSEGHLRGRRGRRRGERRVG